MRSPEVANTATKGPIHTKDHPQSHTANNDANAAPPSRPSQDFPGEMLGINLCFPSGLPTKYAPESLVQIIRMRLKRAEGSYAPEFCHGIPITMLIHSATNAENPQTVFVDIFLEP